MTTAIRLSLKDGLLHPHVEGCQCSDMLVGTTFPSAGGGVGAQKAILRLSASYALYRSRMAAAARYSGSVFLHWIRTSPELSRDTAQAKKRRYDGYNCDSERGGA